MSQTLNLTQQRRLLKITSPLGVDVLLLRRLSVREAIGEPYVITADVLSSRLELQASDLIGTQITCTVDVRHTDPRHFNGEVRSFTRLGPYGRGVAAYRIEAVPRLWQLSRTMDCRIFQDKSIKDIAELIFNENGLDSFRFGSSVTSTPRPYCVQFNETDLDFVQRIFDETGTGYFFEHSESGHTLVPCGANADYPQVPGDQVVRNDVDAGFGTLHVWQPTTRLRPGKVKALDHDDLKPGSLLDKQAATILGTPGASGFEIYHWPGGQHTRPDANPAQLGMEVYESSADLVHAGGSDPRVFAGGRLRVLAGIDATQPVTWLVQEVTHEAYDETHLSSEGTAEYANSLVLMPADRPWRPAAPRPRPMLGGLHSAIVTGPQGEEIHCDEYGRVKVHFLWDRAGPQDDNSSCWVRVAQGFAGAWGGSWMLPRIGDEVLVAFVSGDADRPLIIGSAYNHEQKPIYTLPANKTQSGIKTRSSKDAGASNFNELRFEDKKGSEEIYVQAEKNMTLLVKNDRKETVRRHRTEIVDGKHTETVKLDRSATITDGNETLLVKMGDMDTKVDMGNQSTEVGMGNQSTLVKMGNISTKASLGKIEMEALQSITLTCGQSKIHMTPASIEISSLMVTVKADILAETKAPFVKATADAFVIVKGGMVLIN